MSDVLRFVAGSVRTIVVIREKIGKDEIDEAARLGMRVELVPMSGIFSPSFNKVDRALKILSDPLQQPVLVHCPYGKDRTGVTVASYRTAIESWAVGKAAVEAESYGCCVQLFHPLRPYLALYLQHRRLDR